MVGVQRAQLTAIRRRLGNAYERKTGRGAAAQVMFYAKQWIPAYIAQLKQSPTKSRSEKRKERFQALSEEAKYRLLIREVVEVSDVQAVFSEVAIEWSKAIGAIERMSPPAAERMIVALDSAKEKIAAKFNVHRNGRGASANSKAGGRAHRTK